MQNAALLGTFGAEARIQHSEALHHPAIIGLFLGEVVRHLQQFGSA